MIMPLCLSTDHRSFFEYTVALVPVCSTVLTAFIAGYVALISRRQAKTADRKLSLDLYDRRFQIYMRAVDFYQALMTWSGTGNQESVHDKFIRAKLESIFLFPKFAGVRKLLDEMDEKGMIVIGFAEHGRDTPSVDTQFFADWNSRKNETIAWFGDALRQLESAMVRSMKFHERM